MRVCIPHVCLVPAETRDFGSAESGFADSCQLPHECWKPNAGPWQEE